MELCTHSAIERAELETLHLQQARLPSTLPEGGWGKRLETDLARSLPSNEVYDTEHISNLLKVPGVRAVTSMQGEPFAVSIGGAEQQVARMRGRGTAPSTRSMDRTCW